MSSGSVSVGQEELCSGTGSRDCGKTGPFAAGGAALISCGWGWAAAANPKPLHLLFHLTESSQASLAALAVKYELPDSLRGASSRPAPDVVEDHFLSCQLLGTLSGLLKVGRTEGREILFEVPFVHLFIQQTHRVPPACQATFYVQGDCSSEQIRRESPIRWRERDNTQTHLLGLVTIRFKKKQKR